MSISPNARIRTPEEIAINAGAQLPRLRLPESDVFAARALRLRELAAGHAMRDYLMLMAVVAEAQQARLAHYPAVPLPTEAQADEAAAEGRPLLLATQWPRDPAWREELHALLTQVLEKLASDNPARAGVQSVLAMQEPALEQQAERLLAGITLSLDMAAAPLIAAGLQLYFTHLLRATGAAQRSPFGIPGDTTRCPCCGSLPTASVTRVGGGSEGHRYLHCSLCNAEWHMVRVKCTHCLSTGGIQYRALQSLAEEGQKPSREPVQAETCDSCHHYLKIVHMDKDVQVEPVADDLASLTLDLLVDEEGYERHGVNLLLLFGDSEAGETTELAPETPPGAR